MSKKRPYQEIDRDFNDLPLPDGEAAWQKMKLLLDDEDDDIVPPPIFFRSCLGWGLLFLGLIAAWLIIRPEKWWSETAKTEQKPPGNQQSDQTITKTTTPFEQKENAPVQTQKEEERDIKAVPKGRKTYVLSKPFNRTKEDLNFTSAIIRKKKESYLQQKKSVLQESPSHQQPTKEILTPLTTNDDRTNTERDTSAVEQPEQTQIEDSVVKQTILQIDSSVRRKNIQSKKKLIVASGIGVQQQIPIAGQTAVPYSHYGRKGSLADYIPLVYVKFENQNKWFVQAEFRYGGAQSVKEFSFARRTKLDTSGSNITTTTQTLKKTYYHQFPVSFNYYVQPNLSVGIGGMYSRFYRAVIENEIKTRNIQTGSQTVAKQIVPMKGFTDSFLYKTQVHLLLQADYQWKKFAFGLRYTKDVQPYIRYTKPDGTINEEKNQSLQLIVRYRLWRSGRM